MSEKRKYTYTEKGQYDSYLDGLRIEFRGREMAVPNVPEHLLWTVYTTIQRAHEYSKDQDLLLQPLHRKIYHGTRLSKLQGILEMGGMIPFSEIIGDKEANGLIYFGFTPAGAASHAWHNGPHDSYTGQAEINASTRENDPVVLLESDLDELIQQGFLEQDGIDFAKLTLEKLWLYYQGHQLPPSIDHRLEINGIDLTTNFLGITNLTLLVPFDSPNSRETLSVPLTLANIQQYIIQ